MRSHDTAEKVDGCSLGSVVKSLTFWSVRRAKYYERHHLAKLTTDVFPFRKNTTTTTLRTLVNPFRESDASSETTKT